MLASLPLTESEIVTLEAAAANGPHPRMRRRAQAVLGHHRGLRLDQLATLYAVGYNAVSRWLLRWQRHGVAGLMLLSSSISSAPSTSTQVGRFSMRELVRVAVTSTSSLSESCSTTGGRWLWLHPRPGSNTPSSKPRKQTRRGQRGKAVIMETIRGQQTGKSTMCRQAF